MLDSLENQPTRISVDANLEKNFSEAFHARLSSAYSGCADHDGPQRTTADLKVWFLAYRRLFRKTPFNNLNYTALRQ